MNACLVHSAKSIPINALLVAACTGILIAAIAKLFGEENPGDNR
jgi:hypothetical protein